MATPMGQPPFLKKKHKTGCHKLSVMAPKATITGEETSSVCYNTT